MDLKLPLLFLGNIILIIAFYWKYSVWVELSAGPDTAQLEQPTLCTKLYFVILAIFPAVIYIGYCQALVSTEIDVSQYMFFVAMLIYLFIAVMPSVIRVKHPNQILKVVILVYSTALILVNLYLGKVHGFNIHEVSDNHYIAFIMLLHGLLVFLLLAYYSKVLIENYGVN